MKKKEVSVKGLANIGKLLDRGVVLTSEAPKADKLDTLGAIAEKTSHKVFGVMQTSGKHRAVHHCVEAGVREAHKLGQVEAVKQSEIVEKMLNEQYEGRTSALLPAVAAVIMEQLGMTDMTLDLDAIETVFERCTIDYELNHGGPAGNFISYTLSHLADKVRA